MEIASPRLGDFLDPNFAHIISENGSDALRACDAAASHKIKINDHILTLTVVSDDTGPIGKLDDNCLIEIFSRLDVESKLAAKNVCKRWKGLALKSWLNVKTLDLQKSTYGDEKFENYLVRCGARLDEISFNVKSTHMLCLVRNYCKALKTLTLESMPLMKIYFDEMSKLLKMLKTLKSFTLVEWVEDSRDDPLLWLHDWNGSSRLDVLNNLPESLEDICLSFSGILILSLQSLDLSRFRNLRSLTLSSYDISDDDLKGIENLENLVHLNFDKCFLNDSCVEKLQSFIKLKTLRIGAFCRVDNNVVLRILRNNRDLESLALRGISTLTDHSVLQASMLPRLKDLSINLCYYITLNLIDEMPLLESFDCEYCPSVTNEVVGRLIQLAPNLKNLNIQSCILITAELAEIANSAIEKRESSVVLKIKANVSSVPENLSPLLEFECLGSFPRHNPDNEYDGHIYPILFDDHDGNE